MGTTVTSTAEPLLLLKHWLSRYWFALRTRKVMEFGLIFGTGWSCSSRLGLPMGIGGVWRSRWDAEKEPGSKQVATEALGRGRDGMGKYVRVGQGKYAASPEQELWFAASHGHEQRGWDSGVCRTGQEDLIFCFSEFSSSSRPENWSSREFAGLCMGTRLYRTMLWTSEALKHRHIELWFEPSREQPRLCSGF